MEGISYFRHEVSLDGKHKPRGILVRWEYRGFLPILELFVGLLDHLPEVIGPHKIDNPQPQPSIMLDDQEGVINYFILA